MPPSTVQLDQGQAKPPIPPAQLDQPTLPPPDWSQGMSPSPYPVQLDWGQAASLFSPQLSGLLFFCMARYGPWTDQATSIRPTRQKRCTTTGLDSWGSTKGASVKRWDGKVFRILNITAVGEGGSCAASLPDRPFLATVNALISRTVTVLLCSPPTVPCFIAVSFQHHKHGLTCDEWLRQVKIALGTNSFYKLVWQVMQKMLQCRCNILIVFLLFLLMPLEISNDSWNKAILR